MNNDDRRTLAALAQAYAAARRFGSDDEVAVIVRKEIDELVSAPPSGSREHIGIKPAGFAQAVRDEMVAPRAGRVTLYGGLA